MELELYIHIPFCVRKCRYCDFLSAPADESVKKAYMEALCREIAEKSSTYKTYEITTVFIGGGTPTAVPPSCIERVMEVIRENYLLRQDAEITMEMNPGTVDVSALESYKRAGINRLSIGLQSTVDAELQALGRIHTYEQFLDTYKLVRNLKFENVNVDIMSALPGQTYEAYKQTLERVAGLIPPPEHISAYSLIIEEGTPFFDAYEKGILQLPDEETERNMYELTGTFLSRQGYERYEISNYAREGMECRHNTGYWQRKNYLGFGIGAASMVENVRFHNGSDLMQYIKTPCDVMENYQKLSKAEQMEETMFLGLRLTQGVELAQFREYFGVELSQVYGTVVKKHEKEGLLQYRMDKVSGKQYLALTQRGLDVSNYVMADFLEPCIF